MNQTLYLNCESGLDVMAWQDVLVQADLMQAGDVDGEFGPNTKAATIKWQDQHGLVADGVVGPITWSAAIPEMAPRAAKKAAALPVARVAQGAIDYLLSLEGLCEEDGNRGPQIDQWNKDLGVPVGSPWCLSVQQMADKVSAKLNKLVDTLKPDTARCFTLWRDAHPSQKFGPTEGRRGDVAIFKFSHAGRVLTNRGDGTYETIEGNTNAKGEREGRYLMRKNRKYTEIIGFIRPYDKEIA